MNVAILWCDSAQGKISHRVNEDGSVVKYTFDSVVNLPVVLCSTSEEMFDILRKRDSSMVAIDYNNIGDFLGWQ